jgi:hypothetical protein
VGALGYCRHYANCFPPDLLVGLGSTHGSAWTTLSSAVRMRKEHNIKSPIAHPSPTSDRNSEINLCMEEQLKKESLDASGKLRALAHIIRPGSTKSVHFDCLFHPWSALRNPISSVDGNKSGAPNILGVPRSYFDRCIHVSSTYRLSNKLTKLTGSPPTATKAVFPGNRKEIRRARIDRNTNGIWIGLGEVYPNPVDKREIETNRSEQSTSINSCACIVRVKNASSMRASA